jgi:hypothetical protein
VVDWWKSASKSVDCKRETGALEKNKSNIEWWNIAEFLFAVTVYCDSSVIN